jgi:hypothetical protein
MHVFAGHGYVSCFSLLEQLPLGADGPKLLVTELTGGLAVLFAGPVMLARMCT